MKTKERRKEREKKRKWKEERKKHCFYSYLGIFPAGLAVSCGLLRLSVCPPCVCVYKSHIRLIEKYGCQERIATRLYHTKEEVGLVEAEVYTEEGSGVRMGADGGKAE